MDGKHKSVNGLIVSRIIFALKLYIYQIAI